MGDSLDLKGEPTDIINGFKTSCLLISGLIGLYIRTKLFEQEVKKYRMSYTMFKHAKLSYIDIKGRDGISNNESSSNIIISPQEVIIKKQNVYRNLGISALDEASLWYISNNEQELEKPIGG